MRLKHALRRAAAALLLAAAGMAAAQAVPGAAPTPPLAAVPVGDGRFALRVQGGRLWLQDSHGQPLRDWPLRDAQGQAGTVLAIFDAPLRRSFVVVLRDLAELWEVSVDPAAEPIFDGWVHDYRMGEGLARPGHLGLRRIRLARPLMAVFFDARVPWLVGAEPGEPSGNPPAVPLTAVVLHLDIRRVMAHLPLPDPPLPGPPLPNSALQPLDGTQLWREGGHWLLRLPAASGWTVYDTQRWLPLRHEPR